MYKKHDQNGIDVDEMHGRAEPIGMIIEVSHRIEFGKNRFYPVNKLSRTLLLMMKHRSFTKEQLLDLEEVDFEIKVSAEGWKE